VIRVALTDYTDKNGDNFTVKEGEKVILDVFKANDAVYKAAEKAGIEPKEEDFVGHKFGATDSFADYQPKHIADVGVTAMIKVFAQMKNARRGNDTQGRVKRVRLDASAEGYTNYMAPMRIQRISKQVELLDDGKSAKEIYTHKLLKPETETFLTAQWDEMVPFPNTWKIRFDGFGPSDYDGDVNGVPQKFGKLREPEIADDRPPYYQPRGASHTGGTFADVACTCSTPAHNAKAMVPAKAVKPTEQQPILSNGCGMGGK
jgi:hypothetical protein